ncbi:integrase [Georgenia yuyongxinii]|uniref:Integrase n=1 Tax=Georgenia yuyongxinii TaxID=2589797 RepID=A0A552WXK4_9MICO|nr:integrase [Georgenia yuyongxinii]TRW47560.1 integrase [Georgenia yuyongxinii]
MRAEIDHMSAKAYMAARKKDKGRILSEVVSLTGWSRDTARRRLIDAAEGPAQKAVVTQRLRAPKYSHEARRLLRWVWEVSGEQCGKYLVVSIPLILGGLERHGEVVEGERGYTAAVRDELLSMSAATIDRYLQQMKSDGHSRMLSRTEASALSRSWPNNSRAVDETVGEPGFFTAETIEHCRPGADGEFARTLVLTDAHTGWTFTRTAPNGDVVHLVDTLEVALAAIPFAVVAIDFESRKKSSSPALIDWARRRAVEVVISRCDDADPVPPLKNTEQSHRCRFPYGFDTEAECQVLNNAWSLVNDRLNHFTPTRKPLGWESDMQGRRRRLYDEPATPLDRLLAAGVLSPAQEAELASSRERLNPAAIDHQINELLTRRRLLARDQAGHASIPPARFGALTTTCAGATG